ncbi:ABC transporter permease [Modestobacter sp. VKM Ac-2977]|uniref:ABC transporter permease n=1 Tax=Modestobacter sp. VKM Ac-2977 TaxID=3004131 RepID=UPI0022AA8456|nr:ABC transporter permease [Modestobacter sp. VKM Ac-2977]MCZ2822329.1 ABC transporter permease [Modestobacter sp. VKM Ac-2977]
MTQSLRDVWQYRGLIGNFANREIKGKYKGSLLGSAWSLINPLATLATYSLVFGFILRFPTPVAGNGSLTNFPIYLFTALVVWNFFHAVTTGGMGSLVGAGPLLRKIHFPPFAPVIGSALAVLNQTAIEFGLLFIVYVLVWNIGWTFLMVPVLLFMLAAFALGLGMVLAIVNARFRDVAYIVTVLLGLLFYASPIIYPISLVTDQYDAHPWLRAYEYNPITSYVEAFRDVLWDLEFPGWGRLAYLAVVSFVMLVVGWTFFQRRAADVSEDL